MILIFGALLAVYVFCRAILPLKLKWGWKLLLAALLAVAAVPAGACFGVLWAVFRLTDAILRKTERSNDEG